MFNQIITFQAPAADILVMRDIIVTIYLPIVSQQPGFIRAFMLEHVNDGGHIQLILTWQTEMDCAAFRCSGGIARVKRLLQICLPDAHVANQDGIIQSEVIEMQD